MKKQQHPPSSSSHKDKRQARIATLKALYEQEFHYQKNTTSHQLLDFSEKSFSHPMEVQQHSQKIFEGIQSKKVQIDHLIQEASHAWSLKRMSLIDLNILRIAIYEMFYSPRPIPPKVCMDEAVEVAKLYGTQQSPAFVNGLLDCVAQKLNLLTSSPKSSS